MRAGTDADIFAVTPIDEIVPALRAGTGVVGNFISGKTGFRRDLLRDVPKRAGKIIIGEGELSNVAQSREHGAIFDRELIKRKMVAGAANRCLEFLTPAGNRLTRPRVNEIEGIAIEDRGGEVHRAQRLD